MSQSPPNRVNGSHGPNPRFESFTGRPSTLYRSQSPPNRVNGSHLKEATLKMEEKRCVAIPS